MDSKDILRVISLVLLAQQQVFSVKISQEYADHLNQIQTFWKAGLNFRPNISHTNLKTLAGTIINSYTNQLHKSLPKVHHTLKNGDIPETFDARDKWPQCTTISEILDQGNCGSCWAFAAVESISDRICIYSKNQLIVLLSAKDLMGCCDACSYGCQAGGKSMSAWNFWIEQGIVSGGEYNSEKGCQPYTLPPCNHHSEGTYGPCEGTSKQPNCDSNCITNYTVPYQQDKHFGDKVYQVGGVDEIEQIQAEVFNNGPVHASFKVYEDFLYYKSGVYKHVEGEFLDGHSGKIIGWGVENSEPYWLVVNSWNDEWGDKGYFKISRGNNECGFEENIIAGSPKF